MKNKLLLTGLVSVLLIAGMVFTACPTENDADGGGNGLPVTNPGDLPVLPEGSDYASNETEAKNLLNGLSTGFKPVRYQVEDLIQGKKRETADGYTLNVKDDTSVSGLKINVAGNETYRLNPSNLMEDGYIPKAGDYIEQSQNSDITVKFTADKSAGGATLYKGSRIAGKDEEAYRETIEKVDMASQSGTANFTGSGSFPRVYSLTVSSGGKGGKIILNAQIKRSVSKTTITVSDGDFDSLEIPVIYTCSGSLTVYGANDTAVYTKDIASEADYNEVMAYF